MFDVTARNTNRKDKEPSKFGKLLGLIFLILIIYNIIFYLTDK